MTTVGLLGLGIMGTAMSGHLLAGGFAVVGFDPIDERRQGLADAGGTAVSSAAEVAERADVLLTSLPSADAAQEVCAALAEHARRGTVVVETSTLPMAVKTSCRDLLDASDLVLLDCPISGTGEQARDRDLVVFGSGPAEEFESVRPVLEAFARSVRHLGPFGHGSTMKYLANLLVAVHNVATAEAFALGERAGLDPQQIHETIREGAGNSVIFDKRGRLMVERSYLPATAKMTMFVKDVGLIEDFARELDLPTPMLDATRDLYRRAVDAGLGDADAAALLEIMGPDHRTPQTDSQEEPR